jgi:hypothetical protein
MQLQPFMNSHFNHITVELAVSCDFLGFQNQFLFVCCVQVCTWSADLTRTIIIMDTYSKVFKLSAHFLMCCTRITPLPYICIIWHSILIRVHALTIKTWLTTNFFVGWSFHHNRAYLLIPKTASDCLQVN